MQFPTTIQGELEGDFQTAKDPMGRALFRPEEELSSLC